MTLAKLITILLATVYFQTLCEFIDGDMNIPDQSGLELLHRGIIIDKNLFRHDRDHYEV